MDKTMSLAIMQPYFFPYLGYFQLIRAVNTFVIYDNIEFTKKGWVHRNRLLLNGKIEYFTINLKKSSDYLHIRDKEISPVYFNDERLRILRKISQYYKEAPYFREVFPVLEDIFMNDSQNLFQYVAYSIRSLIRFLSLDVNLVVSSTLSIDHSLKGEEKVLAICRNMHCTHYINAIGGQTLYSHDVFNAQGISLNFIQTHFRDYPQSGSSEFVPGLSIIDILMNNSRSEINRMLTEYDLI